MNHIKKIEINSYSYIAIMMKDTKTAGKVSFQPHLLLVDTVSLAVRELKLQACHFLLKQGHFLFLLPASGQVVVVGLHETSLHVGFLLRPGEKMAACSLSLF